MATELDCRQGWRLCTRCRPSKDKIQGTRIQTQRRHSTPVQPWGPDEVGRELTRCLEAVRQRAQRRYQCACNACIPEFSVYDREGKSASCGGVIRMLLLIYICASEIPEGGTYVPLPLPRPFWWNNLCQLPVLPNPPFCHTQLLLSWCSDSGRKHANRNVVPNAPAAPVLTAGPERP